jgi:hypothetical protein
VNPLRAINRSNSLVGYVTIADEYEVGLALQLLFLSGSESMGSHDSTIVDADSVD